MSGHSKWSTIKRKKGAKDAKRGKIFSRIIKEITVAARMGGGDPAGNARLRHAMDEARSVNMPSDNIERAVKKGTGELEGVQYEELLYEGVGTGGALVVIEVMTDNRNRSAAEIRRLFVKNGGQLGGGGSAAWAFEHKGLIRIDRADLSEEALFEMAVGAGAEDLRTEDEAWVVVTARETLLTVVGALEAEGLELRGARLEHIPKSRKVMGGEDGEAMLQLLEALDEHDDVQRVFSDFEPDDDLLAGLDET